MRRSWVFLFLIPLVLMPLFAKTEIHGYWKSFALAVSIPEAMALEETNPPLGMVANRLRLKMSTHLSRSVQLEAAWDLSPQYSGTENPVIFSALAGTSRGGYRISDMRSRLIPAPEDPEAGFSLSHNLDRLLVTFRLPWADIHVGRQAIAWGSSRVINPTDVIAPFAFNELDTEDRRGVDAVRLRIPLGMMDELDMGWITGKNLDFGESALYLRSRISILKMDTSLILMAFRRHLLLGFDLAGSIGGAGAWLETAWIKPGAFDPDNPARDKAYLRASLGLDYSFSGSVYAFGEYHFNGAGAG